MVKFFGCGIAGDFKRAQMNFPILWQGTATSGLVFCVSFAKHVPQQWELSTASSAAISPRACMAFSFLQWKPSGSPAKMW